MNMYDRLRATEVKPTEGAAAATPKDAVTEIKAPAITAVKPSSSPQATRIEHPTNGVAASPNTEEPKMGQVNGTARHGSE